MLAAAVNIAFKFLLMGPLAQVGLALATSIGAWINLGLVFWFAHRAPATSSSTSGCGSRPSSSWGPASRSPPRSGSPRRRSRMRSKDWHRLRDVATLAVLAAIGGAVYGGVVLALFGRAMAQGVPGARMK